MPLPLLLLPPSSSSLLPPLPPPSFVTTTGKTTPTSASTTYHGAAFPKEAGDPERGTGPDGPPPVGGQGSPDSEPISVEMEGKGEGCLDCTAGPRTPHRTLLTRLTTNREMKFHCGRRACSPASPRRSLPAATATSSKNHGTSFNLSSAQILMVSDC